MSYWPSNFMDTCPRGYPLYRNAILILYALTNEDKPTELLKGSKIGKGVPVLREVNR